MVRKSSELSITDQFCGAGGSSQGARNAANKNKKLNGMKVKVAMNHWQLAVDSHEANFKDTIHDCTDISASDPRRYPSTDILITSPECTNHSIANGKKYVKAQMDLFEKGILDASAERSRATMWDVPRFAEYHRYNIIIVENVVDARKWVMWDSWLHAMHALGYLHKCVYANSMHFFPTPQSRDRMYVVFWKKGNKAPDLEHKPIAHCPKCNADIMSIQTWKNPEKKFGKYRFQYIYSCPTHGIPVEPYYYASFNIIDWSNKGTRIGDRKTPLCENTIRRINYGLEKHSNHTYQNRPLPFLIKGEHTLVEKGYTRSIFDALQTQTTWQTDGIVMPFIVENKGMSTTRKITDPIACQTTKPYLGIVTNDSFNAFISSYYGGSHCTKHITQEAGTFTTNERTALVSFQKPKLEDCYYRMLKHEEIKRGMAFDEDYIILGNPKEIVKQCGNAVTPPAMEWLISQTAETLI